MFPSNGCFIVHRTIEAYCQNFCLYLFTPGELLLQRVSLQEQVFLLLLLLVPLVLSQLFQQELQSKELQLLQELLRL